MGMDFTSEEMASLGATALACEECPPAAETTENFLGAVGEEPESPPFPAAPSYAPQKHSELILTKVERLEVENLSLRIRLLVKEHEEVNREIDQRLTQERIAITMVQRQLQAKYGIDFTKQQIEFGTGRIIPAP